MNKPVLFRVTNNLKVGGVQRRLRALLPLLTEHYEVHVVTYKEKGVFFDELADLGVHTHFLPRKGHWNPVAIWKLARLFRQHRADIVHTHSFGGNIFGILAAALARVPVRIGQVHLSELHWYGTTAARRKKQMLEERLVHRFFSHRVLFVSRESREYFQKNTQLPDEMLTILHNGLDLPDDTKTPPRSALSLPDARTLVGFVGRLTHGKGIERFLEMGRQACLHYPGKYHFVIIGDGKNLHLHQAWVREQGFDQSVTFMGERHDIHCCYAALDCLVFCSDPGVEGMPGVVLEACAHGLPILALETAPLNEIHDYYSRMAFIDDSAPVAEQIEKAMALPPARQEPFRDTFSIEAMKTRTLSLYEALRRQVQA